MKHLLTAFACCLAVAGSAQSDGYPFNPDSDGDGLIGVEDLLALLSDFGMDAEFETCFRGEAYKLEGSTYDLYNYYIPADCGIFTRYDECIYPWGCYNRLPIDANDGDVIYGWLRRSYYYSTQSINFQTWQNDEWTNFFSYNQTGDALVKFTFDGSVWSGGIHSWTTLNPIGDSPW